MAVIIDQSAVETVYRADAERLWRAVYAYAGHTRVGVGSIDAGVIRVLEATAPFASGALLVDWIDNRVIVLTDERLDGHLIGLSVEAPGSQDLGPSGLVGPTAILARSQDRSTWASIDGGIVLTPVGGGRRTWIARFADFTQIGWAPDGLSVGYLRHGDGGGLCAASLDGGEPRRIARGDFGSSVEGWPDTLAWQPMWTEPR